MITFYRGFSLSQALSVLKSSDLTITFFPFGQSPKGVHLMAWAWSSLVLFDDCKLLLTEQFYLTDLSP